jgi:hypothetical protein
MKTQSCCSRLQIRFDPNSISVPGLEIIFHHWIRYYTKHTYRHYVWQTLTCGLSVHREREREREREDFRFHIQDTSIAKCLLMNSQSVSLYSVTHKQYNRFTKVPQILYQHNLIEHIHNHATIYTIKSTIHRLCIIVMLEQHWYYYPLSEPLKIFIVTDFCK